VDLVLRDVCVLEGVLDRRHALAEEVEAKLFELCSGDLDVVVLTIGQRLALNVGADCGGQNALGLLALGPQSAHGALVAVDVDSGLLFEVGNEVVEQLVVEVFTAEVSVSVRRPDLEDSILDGEEGNIESAATEVEDQNVPLGIILPVKAISDCGRGRLIDDAEDVEAGDGAGILRRLALRIVEVSRDRHNGGLDRLAEVAFGDLLHLRQDHGADLFGLEFLRLALVLDGDHRLVVGASLDLEGPQLDVVLHDLVGELAANEPLCVEDGVSRVASGLVLGGVADESLLIIEGDVGGRRVEALVIRDDLDLVVLEDTDTRVRGAEVNAYCDVVCHVCFGWSELFYSYSEADWVGLNI